MAKILKIGHRGAAGYEPENTLRSFRKALALGVDMVELDVYRCGSGELVVIHDDMVNRTTDGKGRVADMSLQELKKLDAGGGEKIPTLEEVIKLVDKKTAINIQLKGRDTTKALANILQHFINEGWAKEKFLVSSVSWSELVDFVEVNPGVLTGVIVGKNPFGVLIKAKQIKAYSIHIPKQYLKIRKGLIKRLKDQGFKMFVFTLNEPTDIALAKELGLDGIFSDYPDRL